MCLSAIRLFSFAVAAVVMFAANAASAASWHACTHPEWLEAFGFSHFLVADALITEFGEGDSVSCDAMSGDYSEALGASCDLAARSSRDAWAELKNIDAGLVPLPCT